MISDQVWDDLLDITNKYVFDQFLGIDLRNMTRIALEA
jgi:hypothetical protein